MAWKLMYVFMVWYLVKHRDFTFAQSIVKLFLYYIMNSCEHDNELCSIKGG
jgi:hypothetical protein